MCNCGKKRDTYKQPAKTIANKISSNKPVENQGQLNFQYTGKTALTIIGSITGRRYRFNYSGDIQMVDQADAGSMMSVPILKKIA